MNPALLGLFPWLALALGLILGSFYTVCVSRYLHGQSIVLPGSHCPACGRPLRWWENIPLLSYVLLRGRCRTCKTAIGWRYPALEAASAAWACLSALHFGPSLAWLLFMFVAGIFLVASFIDLEIYILPDVLTYPGMALGLAAGVLGQGLSPAASLIGAATGAGFFWLLRLYYFKTRGVEGLGMGDVKLMAMIGAAVGWMGLPVTVLFGALCALAASPLYLLGGGSFRETRIPFGPFLCLGCLLNVLWGADVLLLLSGRW